MSEQEVISEARQPRSFFRRLIDNSSLPVVLTSLLVGFCLITAVSQLMHQDGVFNGVGDSNTSRVVSFDPVKFINAQRAAASILAVRPNADLAFALTRVAGQTEAVIREEANGALVLIKQSLVLADDVPDITDAVLQRFGLSTQVPTISIKSFDGNQELEDLKIEDYAPTDISLGSKLDREDKRLEKRGELSNFEAQLRAVDEQRNLLP